MKDKLIKTIKDYNYDNIDSIKYRKDGAMEYFTILLDESNYITYSYTNDIRSLVLGKLSFFSGIYGALSNMPLVTIELDHTDTQDLINFTERKYEYVSNIRKERDREYVQLFLDKFNTN